MLAFIGVCIVILFAAVIIKMILCRVIPSYGLRDAEARFRRNPNDINERLLWDARRRAKNK